MLLKRLLEIFGANAQSKTKKGEITVKSVTLFMTNTL